MFPVDAAPERQMVARRPLVAGVPVEPIRLWRHLVARRRTLAVGVVLAALGGAAAAKSVVPRRFEAAGVVRWAPHSATGTEASPEREFKTVAASVELPENLAAIRQRLSLNASLGTIGRQIEVRVERDSNLLTIIASDEQPEGAQALATAAVEVFVERQTLAERHRLEQDLGRLEARAEQARQAVSDVRRRYDDFRKERGILDLPRERELAVDHAARLRAEADLSRVEARAQAVRARALGRTASKTSETTVLARKERRPDLERLAEARTELAGLEGFLGEAHPKVQSLRAEIEALQTRTDQTPLVARAERTIGRNPSWDALQSDLAEASAQRAAAEAREETYVALAAATAGVVERLSEAESTAVTLLSHVKVSENHLVESEQLVALARDQLRSPRSSLSVVDPPREPEAPARSHRRVVALCSPIVGLLAAALIELSRALRGLRVHGARELAFWGRAPVVASSSWPRERGALADLVADLRAVLPSGGATLIVVGAGRYEAPLARTLARHLGAPEVSQGETVGASWTPGETLHGDSTRAALRRAVRGADRVIVVVGSRRHSVMDLRRTLVELGREDVTFVLVGVGAELAGSWDRAGDVGGALEPFNAVAHR